MPVYEYRCKECGRTHEIEHGFHDVRPTKCPTCGGQLARVFHPVGVVFKGSGFYKTDSHSSGVRKGVSASDSGTETAKSDGKPAEAKSTDGKAAEAKTESKPSSDAKPAASSGGDAKPSGSAKP